MGSVGALLIASLVVTQANPSYLSWQPRSRIDNPASVQRHSDRDSDYRNSDWYSGHTVDFDAWTEGDRKVRRASYTSSEPYESYREPYESYREPYESFRDPYESYEVVPEGTFDGGSITSGPYGSSCSECGPYPGDGPCYSRAACKPTCLYPHRTGVFAEYLFLQVSGVDVAYAQPRDGLDPNTSVPIGAVGVADLDYSSGARLGGSYALDSCTSIVGTYTWYESSTEDQISTDVPNSLHSLLIYPGTFTAASNSLLANAQYDVDFQLADLDYRSRLFSTNKTAFNYIVGARYGHLDQTFSSTQQASPGETTVQTDTTFDGYGLRLGLDGERQWCRTGIFVYGRGVASCLVGSYDSTYLQTNTFAPVQAQTSWTDDRISPILEYELGLGWKSPGGLFRLSAGYYMAAWMNAVTTPGWIDAVQADNFTDVEDSITFDGLTARIEAGW